MAIVARGHVRDRPFARTVYAIAVKRFTGEMAMTDAGQGCKVLWRGGAVVAAESAWPADSLARIALTAGLVTSTQVAELVRALAASPGADQLEALARVARLSPAQASQLGRRALVHRALRIFALPGAEFVLDSDPSPAAGPSPLDVRWLIYHGLRLHYSEERLAGELAAVQGARFRLVRAAEALEPYGFDAAARAVVSALGERAMTLDELAGTDESRPASRPGTADREPAQASGGASRYKDIAAVVYALLATDAVVVEQAAPRAVRSRAQTAPAARAQTAPPPPLPSVSSPGLAIPGGSRAVKVAAGKGEEARKRAADPARAARIRALIASKLAEVDAGADHYQVLGVARDATALATRNGYFELARHLHPDRLRAAGVTESPGDSQRLFARINEAFAVLGNPEQRAAYDDSVRHAAGTDDDAESMAARLVAAEQHFLRGEMALRRNQFSQAFAEFEKAVELNPDEAEHHALLAWTRWCTAADQGAVRGEVELGFKRAIGLSERNVAAHFYRGQVAAGAGELQVALSCFRRVLSIQPDHREAGLQARLIEGRLSEPDSNKKGLLDRLKRR